jgi:glycosyltransferase involved in cell wall biosynthesis
MVVIPNGIDDFWHQNKVIKTNVQKNKFLFVGRFDKNKNVIPLINALKDIKNYFPDIELGLVGGGGEKDKEIRALINENNSWINYYGAIYDKKKLLEIYRSHKYFAMSSIFETFGLVYIEALSQGLPVLYTKNQGIDGLFSCKVGEGVDSNDFKSIKRGITSLVSHNQTLDLKKINFENFCWKKIAKVYEKEIKTIINY